MKLDNKLKQEEGYLLLESIVTLTILATILMFIYPLITDWFILQERKSTEVELARAVYEKSYEWPEYIEGDKYYYWTVDESKIFASDQDQQIGIEIYEINFEE